MPKDTPPMSLESERAVLGGCLLDGGCLSLASRTLDSADFIDGRHRQVFRAMQVEALKNNAVDEVILSQKMGIEQAELASFINTIPTLQTFQRHLAIVREKAVRRKMAERARDIYRMALDEGKPITDVTQESQRLISECSASERIAITDPTLHQEAYEQQVRSWDGLPVFRTGIRDLDADIGGGILPGEILSLVGGEGSMKTSLALHALTDYIMEVGRKVLYVSLDMPAYQVVNRRLMPILGWNEMEILKAIKDDDPAYLHAVDVMNERDAGLFRVIDGDYTIADIERAIRAEAPAVVCIDYLTAVAGFDSELDAARQVTAALRRWKSEMGCTFLVLSQMSDIALSNQRHGDVGTGRGLGGGAIRRLADVVLELLKDKPFSDEGAINFDTAPRIICSVAKTRRGRNGSHWSLHHDGRTMTFSGTASRVQIRNKKSGMSVFGDAGNFGR
jgi:replicative DNA helicase